MKVQETETGFRKRIIMKAYCIAECVEDTIRQRLSHIKLEEEALCLVAYALYFCLIISIVCLGCDTSNNLLTFRTLATISTFLIIKEKTLLV